MLTRDVSQFDGAKRSLINRSTNSSYACRAHIERTSMANGQKRAAHRCIDILKKVANLQNDGNYLQLF